jgi:hypothetical protein
VTGWDDGPDDRGPAPHRPGRGCLAALIVAAVGVVVVVFFAARLLATGLSGVRIR